MLDIKGLKNHPEILAQVDWEMTPRQAFEAYQIKSRENWKHRSLQEVYYFYLSLWKGESKISPDEAGICGERGDSPDRPSG